MVKIVTDTLSDIPDQLAEELGISVVPLNVHFGTDTYRDRVDMSTERFYEMLQTSGVFPTTSAPPPGIFVELFTKLAKETDEILAIMTSSKISAIHESALQAKNMVSLDCKIEVIDSLQVLAAQMFVVISAARQAQSGAKLSQLSEKVKKDIPRSHVRGALATLEYLKKGGRIGKAQALLGSLLKVTPILSFVNGEAHPVTRVRSQAQAMDFIVDFVKGLPKVKELAVEDATTPDKAEMLVDRLGDIFPKERIYRTKISPVLGTHLGPGALVLCAFEGE